MASTVIRAGQLIDGKGGALEDASVIVDRGVLSAVGASSETAITKQQTNAFISHSSGPPGCTNHETRDELARLNTKCRSESAICSGPHRHIAYKPPQHCTSEHPSR